MEITLPGTTMAVLPVHQARLAGGLAAGCLLPCAGYGELQDYGALLCAGYGDLKGYGGALLSAAAVDDGWRQYDCAAAAAGVASGGQSELTCNGGGYAAVVPSRKRGREDEPERPVAAASSAALLPIPGMHQAVASRMAESAMASTSGRAGTAASLADALVAEMCRQGAEIDALVQAECDRLRAGLERAGKRRCLALARAAAAGAVRALRDREVELQAARRRGAELEERLRQAAAESLAWRGAARSGEAVAAGLRATLATLLLGGARAGNAAEPAEEGFGDSGSCCFEDAPAVDAAAMAMSSGNIRRACRACGGGEASVLLLPCRHLCLCRACEPRADACPVCLAPKNAAIHVAA